MHSRFLSLLATLLIATPAAAETRWTHAHDGTAGAAPTPDTAASASEAAETRWYGWQTLAVDAASIATAVGGVLADHALPLAAVGVGGYVVAAPLVHLAHGSPAKAGASLGIHAFGGLVSTGLALGVFQASCHDVRVAHDLDEKTCSSTAFALPLLVGVGLASALDAIFLGHEHVVTRATASISAGLSPTRGGATAGLSGTF